MIKISIQKIAAQIILASILFTGFSAVAGSICDDPLASNMVCKEMKNMRSHILVLEAQRDLVQFNLPFVETVSASLAHTAETLSEKLPSDLISHRPALLAIARQAKQASRMAEGNNPDALMISNTLRMNCTTCHASDIELGEGKLGNVFKSDWNAITARCNQLGSNPYLCKQMYGMISNYGYIVSAYIAGIQDFKMTAEISSEMSRIAKDLKTKNFVHSRSELLQIVSNTADEATMLAKNQDPAAFEKAYSVIETCNKCHSETWGSSPTRAIYSVWK